MNIIVRCEGLEKTGVELVANVAEVREIRGVKDDILIPAVVLQHFQEACPYWCKLG